MEQKDITPELINLLDQLEQIIEAVKGYKARCFTAGFTDDTAEAMALDLHHLLLSQIAPASKSGPISKRLAS